MVESNRNFRMNDCTSRPQSLANLRQSFLDGMSCAASTVNVVTTSGCAGRAGLTVSAMASVSAETEKPTLLICVRSDGLAVRTIVENKLFCVNVLRSDQANIADQFAGRVRPDMGDRFSCAEWLSGATGAPRLIGALVSFDCLLSSIQLVGAHFVLFGSVEEVVHGNEGIPLVYSKRAYGLAHRARWQSELNEDEVSR